MASMDKVRKAAPDDLPQLSTALTRAFFDDPLFAWALPDADRRQRLLPEFFATLVAGPKQRQGRAQTLFVRAPPKAASC